MARITAVTVPKWGLSMSEGTVVAWSKAVGDAINEGDELVDIETTKVTNVALAPTAGVLRRITVRSGETRPVGALIGVIADATTPEFDIDAFVDDFATRFVDFGATASEGATYSIASADTRLGPLSFSQRGDGSGDCVLLIHGFASDMHSWAFNLEELGRGRTLISIDLPGHGTSTKEVGNGNIDEMADALIDVLESLNIERAHLVGHSLGGSIALKLAEKLGARTGRLVLIAPVGLPGASLSTKFLDGLMTSRRPRELRGYLEMLVADPARITNTMVEDLIKFRRVDGVMAGLERIRNQIVDGQQFVGLAEISALHTSLVIVGENDKIVGAPAANTGWRTHVLPEVGHMPHVEAPYEVNALITRFFDSKEAS
jgi:pyruvate dehydrogenase E2 component (dihydrolipoamide acetyltransferase)